MVSLLDYDDPRGNPNNRNDDSLPEDDDDDDGEMDETGESSDNENVEKRQRDVNDDDANDDDGDNSSSFNVGGKIDIPAFCLLDGIFQDPEKDDGNPAPTLPLLSSQYQRVTLPICKLPAVLGRTHKTSDPNFVGMGKAKALSRQQCRIEYRTTTSYQYGQLQSKGATKPNDDDGNELIYVDRVKYNDDDGQSIDSNTMKQQPNGVVRFREKDGPIPTTGFFTITALGKNRIYVNGQRIEQNDTAYVYSGSIVKISTFTFYFFTSKVPSKETIEIPIVSSSTELVSSSSSELKKRKMLPAITSSSSAPMILSSSNNLSGSQHQFMSGQAKRSQTLQYEIDSLSTDDLLQQMSKAIEENVWDRKHQLIGSTLSYRAVLEASLDPSVHLLAAQSKGELSRGEIMEWIAESDRFSEWVEQMLSKMEQKSYQASITKGLIKAEYKRTASTGRYIKWLLPDSAIKAASGGMGAGSATKKKAGLPRMMKREEQEEEEEDNDDEEADRDEEQNDVDDDDEEVDANRKKKSKQSQNLDSEEESGGESNDDDDANDGGDNGNRRRTESANDDMDSSSGSDPDGRGMDDVEDGDDNDDTAIHSDDDDDNNNNDTADISDDSDNSSLGVSDRIANGQHKARRVNDDDDEDSL